MTPKTTLRGRERVEGIFSGSRGGMVAPAAPGTSGRRHSKWGNSAIKGRLARPSDGRVTMVEQEAKERQEKIEKLRCVDGWSGVIGCSLRERGRTCLLLVLVV